MGSKLELLDSEGRSDMIRSIALPSATDIYAEIDAEFSIGRDTA